MPDIASLGVKIDSSQTVAATTALDKFAAAAKPAAEGASNIEKAAKDAAAGTKTFQSALEQAVADINVAAIATKNYVSIHQSIDSALSRFADDLKKATSDIRDMSAVGQVGLEQMRAKFDPLYAAGQKYKQTLADIKDANRAGALTQDQMAAAIERTKAQFTAQVAIIKSTSTAQGALAQAGGLARYEMINLSRQIQDVGVSLVSGQSPFMVLVQQGTQIADIFGSSKTGTVGGAIKQVATGIANFLTPMRVLGGVTALAGAAAYVAYGQWKAFALALDDTAKQAGVTSGEMAKLQASASFKGIDSEEFTKGITSFSQQVYLAKQNAGGLIDVFRANGVQVGTFTGSLEKAADLIQRAGSDQERLVLLQQMGLPANMQWVRYMDQGAEGLRRAKEQAAAFGSAANDNMVTKAREFDEAWNKAWTNFGLGWKSAFVGVVSGIDTLIQKGRQGLMGIGVDVGGNLLKNGLGTQLGGVGDEFYKAVGAKGRTDPNATKDPNAVKNAIALEQQRIGILGQTASVLDQVRSVELQIQSARLNGVKITASEADNLKKLAEANAIGLTQIRSQTDAMNVDAATVGMSVGATAAYTAEMNRLNQARRDGQKLTPDNIAAIHAEATALGEAAQRADLMRSAYEGLVRGPMQTFQQQLANGASFFDALRASGVSALNAISSKLMDMAAQNLWKSAFGGTSGGGLLSLFGLGGGSSGIAGGEAVPTFGAAGDYAVPTFHTGYGPGDALNNVRYVHPAHFNDAPRLHSGIGPGERAAILRTDESVLTPGQMKALGKNGDSAHPVQITNHYTFNGVEPGMEARMRAYIDQGDQRSVTQAVQATQKTAANTPAFRGSFR